MKIFYLVFSWLAAIAIATGKFSFAANGIIFFLLLLSSGAWLRQHAMDKGGWDQVGLFGAVIGGLIAVTVPAFIGACALFFYLWHTTGFAD